MKIEKQVITPEMAAKLLDKNTMNRPVKKTRVAQYAHDMSTGKWLCDTGETIKISNDGTIIDGQHRLLAIVKAAIPVEVYIASDLSSDIFPVIDTGIKRTGKDVFFIGGIKNFGVTSSIVNRFMYIKSGSTGHKLKSGATITNSATLEMYNANPKQWDGIVENTMRWYRLFNRILSPALIGGWYAHLFEIDQDMAFDFFEQLCVGDNIKNPTINVLRNTLIKDKVSQHKMVDSKKAAFILKAWNCFRKGTTLQSLRYDVVNEDMPIAI